MENNDRAKRPRVLSGREESLLNQQRQKQEVINIDSGSENEIPNDNGPPAHQVEVPAEDQPAAGLLEEEPLIRGIPRPLFIVRVREGNQLIDTLQDYYLDGLCDALNNYRDPFDELRHFYGEIDFDHFRGLTYELDEKIDRIIRICEIPRRFETEGSYVLTRHDRDTRHSEAVRRYEGYRGQTTEEN